jgi:hypothetical protein
MLTSAERKDISPEQMSLDPSSPPLATGPSVRRSSANSLASRSLTVLFVLTTFAAIAYGWVLASRDEYTPKEGVGYWLGIAGGTMLLVQLAYPVRKRIKFMHRLGSAPNWFRIHMILGVVGPVIILWHSNFSLGATNSNITLFTMLAVASSGIVGRYIYGKIHRGLYGAHATVNDLLADTTSLLRDIEADVGGASGSIAKVLSDFGAQVLAPRSSLAASFLHTVWITGATPFVRQRIRSATARTIRANAERLHWRASECRQHYRDAGSHIDLYLQAVTKASGLAFYERLFSLWHVFHLPLFCLLITTGVVHVIAVHLY